MKKVEVSVEDDDLRPDYDLSTLKGGVRGKYFERYRAGTNLALLEPDVRAALPDQGIDVKRGQISQVLKSMGMKRQRRRRKAAAGTAAPADATNSAAINIDDLVATKKLVGRVGSIEKVKAALAALARLS